MLSGVDGVSSAAEASKKGSAARGEDRGSRGAAVCGCRNKKGQVKPDRREKTAYLATRQERRGGIRFLQAGPNVRGRP